MMFLFGFICGVIVTHFIVKWFEKSKNGNRFDLWHGHVEKKQ